MDGMSIAIRNDQRDPETTYRYIQDDKGPLASALLKHHAKFAWHHDALCRTPAPPTSSSGGHNPAIKPGIPPVSPSPGDVPRVSPVRNLGETRGPHKALPKPEISPGFNP